MATAMDNARYQNKPEHKNRASLVKTLESFRKLQTRNPVFFNFCFFRKNIPGYAGDVFKLLLNNVHLTAGDIIKIILTS